MAWRIDEAVIRGEIDNRVRGRVTGRIWFSGCTEPVVLDLTGDCWRDLAGRRMEFVNPDPRPCDLDRFAAQQTGTVGDITASRKVRVPEVPIEEVLELYRQRKPFPWHWGNSLYLEWFSERNGRVVIESATFQLTISPDIAWNMTPAEEENQRGANAQAMGGFMARLAEAVAAHNEIPGEEAEPRGDDPGSWAPSRPQTEAEAEKMQADSDAMADRIQARLDREGPAADYAKIIEDEIERLARQCGQKPLAPEERAAVAEWIEAMNRAVEEMIYHPEAERDDDEERTHPVAEEAFELASRLMRETKDHGWLPDDASREHPVVELMSATMAAGAKFAGALNGDAWPPDLDACAGKLVSLKRARGYLADALLAAESCAEENLTEAAWLAATVRELESLARRCDEFIADLRSRLEGG